MIGLLVPVVAGAYIFAPLLMQFMWKTTPLTDDVLREKLEKLTRKSQMKYRDLVVWQRGLYQSRMLRLLVHLDGIGEFS